jgi:hypothetical protein
MRFPWILALVIGLTPPGIAARFATRRQPGQADTAITRIRREVAAVNAGLPRCSRRTLGVFGHSTEGGEMDVYRCGGSIRHIAVEYMGETGRTSEEWYLAGEQPFFVYSVDQRYDRPFGRIVERQEERLYLRDGRLLRWVGPEGRRATSSAPAAARLRELREEISDLLDRARTGRVAFVHTRARLWSGRQPQISQAPGFGSARMSVQRLRDDMISECTIDHRKWYES